MLRGRLNEALKEAMKAKEAARVSTLRMVLAAIKDRDIAARPQGVADGVDDGQIVSLMQGMIKQRQESIVLYEQGDRLELAEKERQEIAVIDAFLPTQLSPAEVEALVVAAIGELGAASIKDMGKVMAVLRERHAGQMDFALAGAVAKRSLSGG